MAMNNLFSLAGDRILLTGAAGGIGSATARVCASLGAELILVDRQSSEALARELSANGTKATSITADTTDRQTVEKIVANVEPLDAVVDCAGRFITEDWLTDPDWDESCRKVLEINVLAPLNRVGDEHGIKGHAEAGAEPGEGAALGGVARQHIEIACAGVDQLHLQAGVGQLVPELAERARPGAMGMDCRRLSGSNRLSPSVIVPIHSEPVSSSRRDITRRSPSAFARPTTLSTGVATPVRGS